MLPLARSVPSRTSSPLSRVASVSNPPRFSTANQVAVDLDLDQPPLLLVTVSVHFCATCQHYFRAQPPFLHPDGV